MEKWFSILSVPKSNVMGSARMCQTSPFPEIDLLIYFEREIKMVNKIRMYFLFC